MLLFAVVSFEWVVLPCFHFVKLLLLRACQSASSRIHVSHIQLEHWHLKMLVRQVWAVFFNSNEEGVARGITEWTEVAIPL